MVFQVVDQFSKEFFKSAFKPEKFKTDTIIFRLHYKLSVWLVILYSVCCLYGQIKGFTCMGSNNKGLWDSDNNRDVANDYCWVHGTYVVTSCVTGRKDTYPGICGITSTSDHVFYLRYYKWMYFFTVVVIILLHGPRQIWRMIEAGRMNMMASKLKLDEFINKRKDVEEKETTLANYLFSHLGYNWKYSVGFLACEALNVVIVGVLLILWNWISNWNLGEYSWKDLKVIQEPWLNRTDPLAKVFPRLSKCTFNLYGPSGNIQPMDLMCVIPVNVIHEWAAVMFWCYFTVVLILGIFEVLLRIVLILSRWARARALRFISPMTPMDDIRLIVNGCSYNDWFVLAQVGKCLEPGIFKHVLEKYIRRVEEKTLKIA